MLKKIKNIPNFFKEVQGELKKVSWSTREELINAGLIVIFVSILLTTYIAGVDAIFLQIMNWFLK
ncbi:MAG: preprotein translocase subunit SecE [Candidatus Omnitrophica bacterium]|nr:preprotein translocase subunit SecE [Candidatus Omnitrophota bacterium]